MRGGGRAGKIGTPYPLFEQERWLPIIIITNSYMYVILKRQVMLTVHWGSFLLFIVDGLATTRGQSIEHCVIALFSKYIQKQK